jgi:hypothetical protein
MFKLEENGGLPMPDLSLRVYRIGNVQLRGSRALKQSPSLTLERALELKFAHEVAAEALRGHGLEVLQFRVVRAPSKENPVKANVIWSHSARGKNKALLVSKRAKFDEPSERALFDGWDASGVHRKRFDLDWLRQVSDRLHAAGMLKLDLGPHNIGVTPDGRRVAVEFLENRDGSFKPERVDYGKFSPDAAARIRGIIERYGEERLFLLTGRSEGKAGGG